MNSLLPYVLAFLPTLTLAAPVSPSCEALVGVTAHTKEGPQENITLVVQNGSLTAMGTEVSAPEGCRVRQMDPGTVVTPGFIAAPTEIGLVEIEAESSTRDNRWGGDPVRADFEVAPAYDPLSTVVKVTRKGGITTTLSVPKGEMISGRGVLARLRGVRQAEAVITAEGPLMLDPDTLPSFAAFIYRLDTLLSLPKLASTLGVQEVLSDEVSYEDLNTLKRVVKGEVKLLVSVDRASDIEALLQLQADHGFDLGIIGGAEAWVVAEQLAAQKVGVIVNPYVYGAGSYHQLHGRADNPALLHAAGVTIGITSMESHNARSTRFVAGDAVRNGLPHTAAIDALTSNMAEIVGLEGMGSLTVGAPADLAVWTGDPLDPSGRLSLLYVGGERVVLESRQDRLVDGYRTTPPAPVTVPVEQR